MMRQLLIRPNAQADINEAARWYEREHPGLGYRFMEALDTLYDRIQGYPLYFPSSRTTLDVHSVLVFRTVSIS